MAEDSVGKQVYDQIAKPFKEAGDYAQKLLGHVPTPGPKPDTSYGDAQRAKDTAAATASFGARQAAAKPATKTADPTYEAHQAPRKARLTRKYGSEHSSGQ
jgi:hypothetical protein